MKLRSTLLPALCMFAVLMPAPLALANVISDTTNVLPTGSSTQSGRLSRSGLQSSWDAGTKPYPGEVNPGVSYSYGTYTYASSLFAGGQYVQVDFYDLDTTSAEFFISAYANSYDPTNKASNYLGDIGSSGDPFGDEPFFQVLLPNLTNLVLVVNTTVSSSAGLNKPFEIMVENFSDTDFDDPTPVVTPAAVPEPSSLILLGTGVLGAFGAARRRMSA